jgi:hypothetical protein
MASITVMKNFIIKKAQGTSDDKLKTIVKILKNYNKLDSDSKKKIQPAIEKLYSKYQEKGSSSKETKKVGSKVSKKKFKTQELKDVISKFKAKIGQKLWKEATSGTTIKQDAERPAKPKGKRYVSKKGYTTNQYGRYKNQVGTPYWDIKQPAKTFPKLAKGGKVSSEQRNRMFNFLKEDLRELEIAIQKNDKQEIEKFFSYWETHLDSLK